MKKSIVFLLAAIVFVSSAAFCGCAEKENPVTYDIRAEYIEGGILNVDMTVSFYRESAEECVKFNAYPSAYREGAKITPLKAGDKCGDFMMISVKVNKKPAKYSLCGSDENVLCVDLGEDGADMTEVGIKYSVKLSESDERAAFSEGWANLGNVFLTLVKNVSGVDIESEYGAIGDPFVSDCANYNLSLTVPGEYVVASGFGAVSCDVNDDKTRYVFSAKNVRDVAFSINKNYSVAEQKSGNRSIKYYYFNDDDFEETLFFAADALSFFEEKFGEYPYDVYSVAQTYFDAGGMEYPCLSFVSENLSREDRLAALVHETAHQWWYGIVGNDQINEPYLDESLAEYSTYLYFSENNAVIDAEEFMNAKRSACAAAEHVFTSLYPEYSGKVKRGLKDFINGYDYVNAVYNKGALMMKAAEDTVGRKKLVSALRRYRDKNEFTISDTEKLLSSMNAAGKIVSSYLDGKIYLPL